MAWRLWWLCICVPYCLASAEEQTSNSLVIGFERFGRHAELADNISGGLLVAELNCAACHATNIVQWKPKSAPDLSGAGVRLQSNWLRQFLADPQSTNGGTTMPSLLSHLTGTAKENALDALVAFLSDQRKPLPEISASGAKPVPHEFWIKGQFEQGKHLYHEIGCVACHEPRGDFVAVAPANSSLDQLFQTLDEDEIAKLGLAGAARSIPSIPLPNLPEKYSLQSLAHFLYDPHSARPAGRMPNLKLSAVEAADIAKYLLGEKAATAIDSIGPAERRLRDAGRVLFGELGCANCHSLEGIRPSKQVKPLKAIDGSADSSCIGNSLGQMPHFSLDAAQKESLVKALQSAMNPHGSPYQDVESRLSHALLQLNCLACHERNKQGGVARGRTRFFETVGQVDLGDEGRLPPPLTLVGSKHHPAWLKKVLQGSGDIRSYLRIRMPKYASDAVEELPDLFRAVDIGEQPSKSSDVVFGERAHLAEPGRALFDLGCVQCHPVRGESLPGVMGIDLAHIGLRVQPEWFRAFLLNPVSLKARTRMPTFFAQGSVNQQILDGNVDRQIASLWKYLEDIDKLGLPKKIELARAQSFELKPQDKPIVFRTFMEHAGTHAIAVGFPQGVHFAIDTEEIRLAEIWRGRFLDAQSTWFSRAAPAIGPLSDDRLALASAPDFAPLANDRQPWPTAVDDRTRFLGFKLDACGAPQFEYQIGPYTVSDKIAPLENTSLVRELRVSAGPTNLPASSLWFRAMHGSKLHALSPATHASENGLKITIQGLPAEAAIRQQLGQWEWLIPIQANSVAALRVEYRW